MLRTLLLSPASQKKVPELKEAIRRQEITVSNARKITPVLTAENSGHWLKLAKNLPKPELEKEVAKIAPQVATPESVKYVSEDRLAVRLGLSEKILKNLRRVQDLLSQKSRKSASMEEALEELLEFYLQRNDPVEKAKRLAHDASAPVPGTDKVRTQTLRRKIPAQIKHQINLRDQGCCTHYQNGYRCKNKRWLEVHHQIPLAMGGKNTLENLTTLCWAHHKLRH